MNKGRAETTLNAQNAEGQPFHPEHRVWVEWERVHDFQYDYVIFLDGVEVSADSVNGLGRMWIAYMQALSKVWWG